MAPDDPRRQLARRLRALRLESWPGRRITQQQLAAALGEQRSVSVPLISSWESTRNPKLPPVIRLADYATFFATERSLAGEPYQVLAVDDLTTDEAARRDELLRELTRLRTLADHPDGEPARAEDAGLWQFPVDEDITIVCGELGERLLSRNYTDPNGPDYTELYSFADLDSLVELYGHIRVHNPNNNVQFRTANQLGPDDFTSHLVLLGGVDFNDVTRDMLNRLAVPVEQVRRTDEDSSGCFQVIADGEATTFQPTVDRDGPSPILVEDVCHFVRATNPFNWKRTLTICNGMFARGTYGAVRALTDHRFRDRNTEYVRKRFAGRRAFSIVSRVVVFNAQVLTPDWTSGDIRLHEWPEARA